MLKTKLTMAGPAAAVMAAFMVVAVLAAVSVIAQQPAPDLVVIDRVNILDGNGGPVIRNGAIVVENGRITQIGVRGSIKAPSQNIINATGKWAIPGLIDAHVHFDQSADIYTRPDVIDLRKWRPYATEVNSTRERIPVTLQRYLLSGVTGIIDMGGPSWTLDVREMAMQTLNAPRVAVAGALLSTHIDPELETSDPAEILIGSPEQAREIVRKQAARRPDLIKILFLWKPGDNLDQKFEIVRAAIEESHANKIRVAVHATELATAKVALRAGADILAHSVEDRKVDLEFIDLVKKRDVLYIPTLAVTEGYYEVLTQKVSLSDIERRVGDPQVIQTWSELARIPVEQVPRFPSPEPRPKRPVMFDNLQLLESLGVRIAAGSDAGNIGTLHGPAIHREFELMAEAGMRPSDILVAATKNAAAVMGREAEVGTLAKGKLADILLLDADPAADIRNVRKIFKVMKNGKFITIDESSLK